MKSKYARWGVIQLLTIVMVVMAGTAFAAGESLKHNSNNLGTKYGTWGVAGGTYGAFDCTTCHSTTTNNIKRVVESIPDTIGPNVNKPVVFNNMTGLGDDSVAHTTSFRVCEVCHTQTKYHRYNTTGQTSMTHPNTDCSKCHPHADGFKATGCTACHDHNLASGKPIATGNHTAHINNAALLGSNYSCAVCHAPTVSDDTTFSDAANHDNGTKNYGGTLAGSFNAGTCTAYCHTNGKGGAAATPVNWTSGPALDCKGCHGGAGSIAGEPRYANGGGGAATANSHLNAKHVAAAADCVNCHVDTTTNGTSIIGSHTNQTIDVRNGGGKTFTYSNDSNKNCSNISCHSNGFFTPAVAQWGATLDCAGCHASTGLTTGNHSEHINTTKAAGISCASCHDDTAANNTSLKGGTLTHMNTAKDVKFAIGGGSNCSNVYCHSYGTIASGTFTVKKAPVWGDTWTANCYSCHGSDSTTGLLNNMSTGRHKKHMVGQYSYGCAVCHATTVSNNTTISDAAKHVNVQIDVAFSGTATTGGASATYTNSGHAPGQPGTVNDSCQNIYCHSNAQVQPGHANPQFRNLTGNKRFSLSTAASLGCSGCHGSTTTTGQFQLSGKHLSHTNTAVGRIVDCYLCHINGGTTNNRINHANGMVNYSSQLSGRVTVADGKCNNVYCHSNAKGTFINMSNANWFSTRTLDCKGCHGGASSQAGEPAYVSGAAGSVTANNHPQHVGAAGANATCQNCHRRTITGVLLNRSTHTVSLAGSNRSLSYHADQNMSDASAGVYAGNGKTFTYTAGTKTCSNISCHSGNGLIAGVADAQWGGNFTCESCHGGNAGATNKITSGKHGQHTNQAGALGVNFGCVECHAQTVSNDTTLAGGNTTHMNALANFSGAKAGKNKAACTAAYCHSDGKGAAGATAVTWTGATTLDCKGCHGGASSQAGEPVYSSTLPGTLRTNSHPKHVGTSGADTTCQNCHGNTMNVTALNNTGNHLNASINVIQGNSKVFTYSNDSSKTCSNISCHSGGGMFTAADIQWGATMPTDCTGCHGNGVTGTLSGAHSNHVNNAAAGGNLGCKECHVATISNPDNRTITDANKHGNTVVNYSGARAGNNKNCANIYCHSNGKGSFAAIPAWTSGTNLTCESCHATGALQVDHATHIAKGATCAQCHSQTTTTGNTITGTTHVDGTVELQQGGSFASKSVTFTPAGTTCNNISCHSPYVTPVNSATWGVALNCNSCHPQTGLSGAHQVHMGALDLTSSAVLYNMTANRTPIATDAVRKHGFGCAECHPIDAANHLNGAIDVDLNRVNVAGVGTLRFLNASSAGYGMMTDKKCSNIYCHSNASRVEAESNVKANTSLAWTDTFAAHEAGDPNFDRCAQCHGNQPSTGAHVAHAISNHADNIYNGKAGKVGFSGTGNSAHGNPNTTTTITCYICHTDTVSAVAHGNDKNTRCRSCHNGTAIAKGVVTINNLANHVNGSREIKFAAIKVRSKAQVRPASFKFYSGVWKRAYYKDYTSIAFDEAKVALDTATMWHPSTPSESKCSNLACHNGYEAKWNMANWNDPNKCMDCHFKL